MVSLERNLADALLSSKEPGFHFRAWDRLRLASAGLTVATGATATTAGGLGTVFGGLLAVVGAAGVAVTVGYSLD